MTPIRAFAAVLVATLLWAPAAFAQSGQSKYNTWCSGCHGNPSNNKDGVLGGKDWNIIKLAMDTRPDMTQDLRPSYNAGLLTDADFMLIAGYLATFSGGVTSQLAMPTAAAFGTVGVGIGSSIITKSVSSIGNAAVQITTVSSSNPLEFPIVSRTCSDGAFVNPLSSCTVSLQFTPAVAGARSATITVTSNGIGTPQSFAANGTGQSGMPPPPPPPPPPASGLSVPSTLGLGSQPVGVMTAGTVLAVSNPGASSVTVTNVQTSSVVEFPMLALTCGTVGAGASCSVTLGFKPQAAGARSGTLTITTNGVGSPHVVALSGTGTTATPVANKVPVVEYFHAGFGHYFTTADPGEIAGLDAGAYNFAFVRTGGTYKAWDTQVAGTVPVCRFFTVTFAPKSSHFYTANADECEGVKLFNHDWEYEKIAYYIAVPTAGVCPVGTLPVYRMYNHGQTGAPNHRFTTDFATYQLFTTTQGWDAEGIGFCAPP